jgi:hypothetical protein
MSPGRHANLTASEIAVQPPGEFRTTVPVVPALKE